MGEQYFTPTFKPFNSPSIDLFDKSPVLSILKDSFKFHTVLAIGAVFQIPLCLVLPLRWAIVPACALLLNSLVTTFIQTRNPSENYAKFVVPGRVSALPPSLSTGRHGPKASSEPLVVFHLGAQPNHPLGLLGPGWAQVGKYFQDMMAELEKNRDEYGFMGKTHWTGSDRPTHNTMLTTFYFRDVEGLHKFAHGDLHRVAWDGYNRGKEWNESIGIFHETFVVQPGGHETVYVNAYPTMLGRATVKAPTEDGEKYVNTLVNANVPALKTQWARLGRDTSDEVKNERESKNMS